MHLVVDAANVVGSRPDGWWRDRAGAAARLVDSLVTALRTGVLDGPVTVVLEGAARAGVIAGPVRVTHEDVDIAATGGGCTAAPAGPGDAVALLVVHADTDGDSAIVEQVRALVAEGATPCVVTADRLLRARARSAGATSQPPSHLLAQLR